MTTTLIQKTWYWLQRRKPPYTRDTTVSLPVECKLMEANVEQRLIDRIQGHVVKSFGAREYGTQADLWNRMAEVVDSVEYTS